jgi:3-ketosteroid 9alpha-monooxygenase subunit A
MSRFPLPRFPDGWFQVAYSDELPNGGVVPLKYFGKDLVLYRGESGVAAVLDAFCPHLGAHLGYGGKVVDDCIRCPFHAWKYDTKGACVEIPYSKGKIPAKARVAPWEVREINGLLMVWFSSTGAAPSWEVPLLPEYNSAEWTPYEKRSWKVKTHNQDMCENAVDSAHFFYVHGTGEQPTSTAEARGHVLHVASDNLMRTPMGKVKGTIEVDCHGFGFTTTRFRGIVDTLLVSSATTIDDEYVDLRFSFMVKKLPTADVTSTVGAAFMREVTRQLEQDIPIWENKAYVAPPMVVEGDGPIGVFRRWVKQFYPAEAAG